jgi:archaellum biogenesis protein FlaJ (TadC family)
MRGAILPALGLLLLLAFLVSSGTAAASGSPIVITPISPGPGGVIASSTPTISASFSDSSGTIDPSSVVVTVDGLNVTGLDSFDVSAGGFNYTVPSILALTQGNHTVVVSVSDSGGNHAEYSWGFSVNASAVSNAPLIPVNVEAIVVYIAVGAGIAGAAAGGYILYLKRTRRFTFARYFAVHPVKKEYVVLYIPAAAAFVFVLVGFLYVFGTKGLPVLAPEYVAIGGLYIGLTLFAIDARRERQKLRAYERAFAQFLFEMADAMRGGIDPAKAITELSKTSANILRKPLRIAADGIKLGRPFDEVLRNMVAPMKSPLVKRYADLIADASTVGGETSVVVHRAAKDLDDFVKIEVERGKQLLMPVAVLYIAFGVLMAVLFSLLYIAPTLGSINISFFGTNPLAGGSKGASGSTVPKLDPTTLKVRFFDLLLIISLGTGAIIGAFTEGKARYGLLHSLALVAGTVVCFLIIFP